MTDVAHADARVNSLFEPGFTAEDRVLMDAKGLTATPGVLPEAPPVEIHNGRELQTLAAADRCFSEAAFFEAHSFVLVDHYSGVQNWHTDAARSRRGARSAHRRRRGARGAASTAPWTGPRRRW